MLIQTKYHGEAAIDEAHKITFEHGIPGFIEEKHFIMLPLEEGSSFFILQSIQSQNTAFVVTSPFFFFKDYEFDLDESSKELLMIESPDDVEVFVILTVSDPFTNSTANLQGPLILNKGKRLGKQLILNKSEYTTKHRLWEGA
ncbi:flagellar assembly protein FliW [Peribacillus frigoritolerans]|uniref:flagellar assembly protein FliW n=1 Tax=Peribacillus frigoritolerans TaxID=450367 RepID=UPI00105A814D|nr:flagellar assembly protein FliW [Peribacillus frigoritolerans]TDL78930.1 flagellar assembly protein FliW [Peribacillus frigoritolerans]